VPPPLTDLHVVVCAGRREQFGGEVRHTGEHSGPVVSHLRRAGERSVGVRGLLAPVPSAKQATTASRSRRFIAISSRSFMPGPPRRGPHDDGMLPCVQPQQRQRSFAKPAPYRPNPRKCSNR
jgi:hypothetical protein